MREHPLFRPVWALLMAGALAGCSTPPDERLAELARQSLDAQARQNEQLAEQNQQVIEASKELVAADAQARGEMAELQRDLQLDQRELGRQRDGLEEERRQLARERYREQLIAAAITTVGLLIIAGLPILLGIYLLRVVHTPDATDTVLVEALIEELLTERPLPLEQPRPRSLPNPQPLFDVESRPGGGAEGSDEPAET